VNAVLAGGGAGPATSLGTGLASLVGGSIVTTTSTLAAGTVAALLLVGGGGLVFRGTEGPAPAAPPASAEEAVADTPPPLSAGGAGRAVPAGGERTAAPDDPRSVRGRVIGPGGAPVAARSYVQARDVASTTAGAPTTIAGADGSFSADAGDAAEVRIAATADGFAPTAVAARAGVAVTLRLRPDRMLSLRLVDVRDPAGPFPDPFAPPRLRVRATGYRRLTATATDSGSGFPRPIPRGTRVDLARTRGARVEVRVVRPDGTTPAAGATVRGDAGTGAPVRVGSVWRVLPHAFTALGEATAAADGTGSLDAAEANAPTWWIAEAPAFLAVRHVRERPGASEPLELVLRPTLEVTGRVVDTRGRPVAGAEVEAKWRQELASRKAPPDDPHFAFPPAPLLKRWRNFTGADGAFAVEGSVAPDGAGDVSLGAAAAGFDFAKAQVARPAAGPVAPVTLLLAARPGGVTVCVRDREARPVVGAIVGRLRTFPQAVPDAEGLATYDPTSFPADER